MQNIISSLRLALHVNYRDLKILLNKWRIKCLLIPIAIEKVSNTNVRVKSYFSLLDKVNRDSSHRSISSRANIVAAKMNNLVSFLRNLDLDTNELILMKSYRGSNELVNYRQLREAERRAQF
jgi:hypothetical protein